MCDDRCLGEGLAPFDDGKPIEAAAGMRARPELAPLRCRRRSSGSRRADRWPAARESRAAPVRRDPRSTAREAAHRAAHRSSRDTRQQSAPALRPHRRRARHAKRHGAAVQRGAVQVGRPSARRRDEGMVKPRNTTRAGSVAGSCREILCRRLAPRALQRASTACSASNSNCASAPSIACRAAQIDAPFGRQCARSLQPVRDGGAAQQSQIVRSARRAFAPEQPLLGAATAGAAAYASRLSRGAPPRASARPATGRTSGVGQTRRPGLQLRSRVRQTHRMGALARGHDERPALLQEPREIGWKSNQNKCLKSRFEDIT